MKCFIILLTFIVADCAIAGEYYHVNGTKYYISHPLAKNYHGAFRYCTINGMHLVSVHTQENHNAVREAIAMWNSSYPEGIRFWTSGTSLGHYEKEFYWAATGFPLTFTYWISGSPSSADRKCIMLHGGMVHKYHWYDQDCNVVYPFICEDKIKLPNTINEQQCEV